MPQQLEEHILYNGRIKLYFNSARHLYYVYDEMGVLKPIMGVTTASSALEKPALINWAVNKVCIPYLQQRILPNRKYDHFQLDEIFKEASKEHTKKKADAASLGSKAHLWAELYIKGMKPKLPKQKGLRFLVDNFLKWLDEYKVKFLESEKKIYSIKYDYAGTLDFEAIINGELCIGDFKTASGIWDEYKFQIAAYNAARAEETGKDYKASWIIRFSKDTGGESEGHTFIPFEALYIPKEEHEKDFQAFLGAMTAKKRLLELERERKIRRLQKEL